ncbi:hypothetical protein ACR2XX_27390 [Klebsiella pneumoniae]
MGREFGVEESLVERIGKRRLQWYGHVKRMDNNRCAKKWMEMELEGVRRRGRPKKTYESQIGDDLRKVGLIPEEVRNDQKWSDRIKWRRLIHHTRATRGYG